MRTHKNKSMAPTLEDVAKVAGISAMSVSRAINTPEKVSIKTKEKVKKAIATTGYIPNKLAGSLASNKSKLVAIVVPQINNSMFVETIEELNKQLEIRGYHVLLCINGFNEKTEEEIITTILSRRPDGVVLTGVHHTNELKKILLNSKTPVVEIWDSTPTPIDMLVGFSHQKVGRSLAQLVKEKGYQSIGLIWTRDERALKRKQGLLETLCNENIDVSEVVVATPTTVAQGRQAFVSLLENKKTMDVILCSTDTLAQGCIIEAQKQNIAVPKDMAVIGFGNLEISESYIPSITTVRIDRHKIGYEAANFLADRIDGISTEIRNLDIGFSIVHRDSTA